MRALAGAMRDVGAAHGIVVCCGTFTVEAVAILVGVGVGLGWQAQNSGIDPRLTSHKRGASLSVLRLGHEKTRLLVLGHLPLSLLDCPLPFGSQNDLSNWG